VQWMLRESDLKAQTSGLPSGRRVLAEDSAAPPGRGVTTKSEMRKHTTQTSSQRERTRKSSVSEKREDEDPPCPERERTGKRKDENPRSPKASCEI
jgi:hypothetical protein